MSKDIPVFALLCTLIFILFPSQSSYARDTLIDVSAGSNVSVSPDTVYKTYSVVPVFSLPGGFFDNLVNLTLSLPDSGASIRYTTDGSAPTVNSLTYTAPLKLDSTSVISARAFKEGFLPGNTVVNTYFIKFQTELPVFSISTDPANFFSDTTGIYVEGTRGITALCSTGPRNWNQDWERPVNLEFFGADKIPEFNVKSGIKIYGGCSRIYDMKSLAFYFRDIYGFGKLHYRLFNDIPVAEFNNFILRSSSQDWWRTMFRDGMIHTLVKQNMNVDCMEYRPSVVFINGQYWGIHNIREMLNEHYINYRYGIDPDSVDLIQFGKTGTALNGDLTAYSNLNSFLSANSLSIAENYAFVKSAVDIDEYIDYQIAEIYSANGDWPANNTKFWRERSPSGKWRWMLYDTDFGFGGNARGQYNTNTLEQATAANGTLSVNPPWATLMLRRMLENDEFKNEFIQRFAVHMSTTFEKDHVISIIDSMASKIASEIPRHMKRWPKSISLDAKTFSGNVQIMKDFAAKRQAEVRSHFYPKFALTGVYSLSINRNNPSWGKVIAHTVELKTNDSKLILFKNIPFKVKSLAMPGYRFARWEGASTSTSPELTLTGPPADSTLTAVFEPCDTASSDVVINEINYKSSAVFNTEDWVELFNQSAKDVDMSGWRVQDNNKDNAFIFPAGTNISAHGYLVVCRDSAKFNSLYPDKINSRGNLHFGLDSEGDLILLLDKNGNPVDSVKYGSAEPWPSLSQRNGPTLSLINPGLDNSLGKNWKTSSNFGTPGWLNDTYLTGQDPERNPLPLEFRLFENYPNPFNNSTMISFSIPARVHVTLKVYDLLGRLSASLVDEEKNAGRYNISFSMTSGSGIYICVLQAGNYIQSKKMILLK